MSDINQDLEIWMPLDVQNALDREEFPVTHYDGTSEQRILDECLSCRKVGLSHIKLGSAKAILICLTTDKQIFVFDMRLPSHEELFKIILKIASIEFYTIKGPYLEYNLKVEFGIDLDSTLDLTAFDIFLSMRRANVAGVLRDKYSMKTIAESLDDVKYRDRIDLAKYWLNVDLPPKDSVKEGAETQVIKDNPRSTAAANVIRKRSCLIRALGLKMQEKLDETLYQDTENLYDFADKVKGDTYTEYENLMDNSYLTMINFLKLHGCDGSGLRD